MVENWRIGTVVIEGYPVPVMGLVDQDNSDANVTTLRLGEEHALYSTRPGEIIVSDHTLAQYLGFGDNDRLSEQIRQVAGEIDEIEGLNLLNHCIEQGITYDMTSRLERAVPVALVAFRDLLRQLAEHSETARKKMS